jgi:hypothetical protein
MSNCVNALASLVWATDTGVAGSTASNVLMFAGHRKRDGVEAMIYAKGYERGWARGSISGMLANLKSVAFVLAPQLYTRLFAATGGYFYGSPMVAAALTAVFAEFCMIMARSRVGKKVVYSISSDEEKIS